MSLGLCLYCGQAGRNLAVPGARAAYIDPSTAIPEKRKKEEVVILLPREPTV